MRTSQKTPETIATIGIDLGKNTFHLVGLDKRGAIALQRKVSRSQPHARFESLPQRNQMQEKRQRKIGMVPIDF